MNQQQQHVLDVHGDAICPNYGNQMVLRSEDDRCSLCGAELYTAQQPTEIEMSITQLGEMIDELYDEALSNLTEKIDFDPVDYLVPSDGLRYMLLRNKGMENEGSDPFYAPERIEEYKRRHSL